MTLTARNVLRLPIGSVAYRALQKVRDTMEPTILGSPSNDKEKTQRICWKLQIALASESVWPKDIYVINNNLVVKRPETISDTNWNLFRAFVHGFIVASIMP